MILAIILLLLAIGVLGFFIFRNIQNDQTTAETTPTPTTIPTPTPDPTESWKIYTNTKIGFSFKYPEGWTEKGPEAANDTTIVYINSDEKFGTGPEQLWYFVWTTAVNKLPDRQYTKGLINNYTSYKTTDEPSRFGALGYFLTKDEKQYIGVFLTPYNSVKTAAFPSQDKYEVIFDQILSTFKFIEATPSGSPTISPSASPTTTP